MPVTVEYSQSATELDKSVIVSADGLVAGDAYSAALVSSLGLQVPFGSSSADDSGHAAFTFTVRITDPVLAIPSTAYVFHIPATGGLPALVGSINITLLIP